MTDPNQNINQETTASQSSNMLSDHELDSVVGGLIVKGNPSSDEEKLVDAIASIL